MSVPSDWRRVTPGGTRSPAIGWYRLRFMLPSTPPLEALGVWLGYVNTCETVYLNGALIGREDQCQDAPIDSPAVPRAYELPRDKLRLGAENILAVRVRSGTLPPFGIAGPDVAIGSWPAQARARMQARGLAHLHDGALAMILLFLSAGALWLWRQSGLHRDYVAAVLSLLSLSAVMLFDNLLLYEAGLRGALLNRVSLALCGVLPGIILSSLSRLFHGVSTRLHAATTVLLLIGVGFGAVGLSAPLRLYSGWLRASYELYVSLCALLGIGLLGWAARRKRPGAAPVLAGTLLFATGTLLDLQGTLAAKIPTGFLSDITLLVLLSCIGFVILGRYVTAHREVDALGRRLLSASEEERRRLSRELHDRVAPSLALVKMDLEMLASQASLRPGEGTDGPWRRLIGSVASVIEDLRSIAHDLRPSAALSLGLDVAMQRYVERLSQSRESAPSITLELKPLHLSPDASTHLYRVFQEGLHNVMRHALAKRVHVRLAAQGDDAIFSIEDDGVGIADKRRSSSGVGLLSIAERAALLGGRFVLRSAPGRGTKIEVRVPLTAPANKGS